MSCLYSILLFKRACIFYNRALSAPTPPSTQTQMKFLLLLCSLQKQYIVITKKKKKKQRTKLKNQWEIKIIHNSTHSEIATVEFSCISFFLYQNIILQVFKYKFKVILRHQLLQTKETKNESKLHYRTPQIIYSYSYFLIKRIHSHNFTIFIQFKFTSISGSSRVMFLYLIHINMPWKNLQF